MSALDRVVATAIEHRVPVAVNWHSVNNRSPRVQLLIEHATGEAYFSPGARGWRFKCAVIRNREIRTLREVLDMIAAEGQRIDADMGGDAA